MTCRSLIKIRHLRAGRFYPFQTGKNSQHKRHSLLSSISRLFAVASDLHENFYENHLDAAAVAESLDDVAALLDKLLPLLDRA